MGADGDVLVLEKGSFELVHVLAHGKRMVRDGDVVVREAFLAESNRKIVLEGDARRD